MVKKRKINRPMRGGDFKSFIGKVGKIAGKINSGLRSTKIISKLGNALGSIGVPYAGAVGSVAGKIGYGKKRIGRPRKVGRPKKR